ncbi:MAG: flagellar hook-length control protein FliK [Alphaproteobacteria bacterium]
MTLNFFTSENGFQKSLIDPSVTAGSKKDYTTPLKRDEFSTSRSKSNHQEQTDKNEKFADMMNNLKEKTTDRADNKQATADNVQSIAVAKSLNSPFTTKQSAPVTSSETITFGSEDENTEINLANIASLNAEIQRLIEAQANQSSKNGDVTTTVDNKIDEANSVSSLLSSVLNSDKNTGKDSSLLSILKSIQDTANTDAPSATTSGLTIEQLTALQEHIQNYMNDALSQGEQEELEAIAAQWVSIQPVTRENSNSDNKGKDNTTILSTKADTPITKGQTVNPHLDSRYDGRYDQSDDNISRNSEDADIKARDFKSEMKNANPQPNSNAVNNNQAQRAGQQFLQSTGLNNQGQMVTSDLTQTTATSSHVSQTPIQSSLTNVITQSQGATQAHPATQMVSATIQKAVKAGEDTNIKLKLDPPELGRVEVKMSIDKDNSTKIILTAEKPETYMMLKQDSDALERALNSAGLDTDGELSFELASENHEFNQDKNQSSNGKQNGNSDGLPNEDVIETSMDWQVDPQTGQMHYSVLV